MIDHILGRPSLSWKRAQVILVLVFWTWRIVNGNPNGPNFLGLRRANKFLKRFTPWQLIVSSLCGVYAMRNMDKLLGLGGPDPLKHLYSHSYYRATWINTGLDAGFATAMTIRPKWLRNICSILFSVYYIVYAHEADEKLRRYRAVPTVEMLRATWEKTSHPLIKFTMLLTSPRVSLRREIVLQRPSTSAYSRPIHAVLFFAPPAHRLSKATDLILDIPGGGFIAMTPESHEERLRMWAWRTGKPVLSLNYAKAPEYPYPFATDECLDCYRILVGSRGKVLGMSGRKLNIIMTGDSAGGCLVCNVVVKILEANAEPGPAPQLPLPLAIVLNYAALEFNYGCWMSPENLKILRSEQNTNAQKDLGHQKDHLSNVSPLSMIGDRKLRKQKSKAGLRSSKTWRNSLGGFGASTENGPRSQGTRRSRSKTHDPSKPITRLRKYSTWADEDDEGTIGDESENDVGSMPEEKRPIEARVRSDSKKPVLSKSTPAVIEQLAPPDRAVGNVDDRQNSHFTAEKVPAGTRLTMTSRVGYFQDRIISPTLMRTMAIMYIGPHGNPDFSKDYHISPILTPAHILAQFPPVLLQCGERDPFVDDTVIFAGRIREAKRARLAELDNIIDGTGPRLDQGLRMTQGTSAEGGSIDEEKLAAMKAERAKLDVADEEEWVTMVLFTDWSHGYLQMPMIFPEARRVIDETGRWIDDAFDVLQKHAPQGPRVQVTSPVSPKLSIPQDATIVGFDTPSSLTDSDRLAFLRSPGTSDAEDLIGSPILFKTRKVPPLIPSQQASIQDGRKTQVPIERKTGSTSSDTTLRTSDSGSTISSSSTKPASLAQSPKGRLPTKVVPSKVTQLAAEPAVLDRVGSPAGSGAPVVTENELLQRRRMLDAHFFDKQ